ncbi:MAG: peptidase [Prolixibacteraceae bacterium]|nr:peptidase [Prolixibacteraceae bacterium]
MKRIFVLFIFTCVVGFYGIGSPLLDYLKRLPEVEDVEMVASTGFFTEGAHIKVRQPVDHRNPAKGTFLQRVFISMKSETAPVVLVTEGYAAHYGANPSYINELTRMTDGNQVVIEHRYFGYSWPDSIQWEYLTVENAATDHHKVTNLLKPFFTGKWINTGISKGGQTAMLHRVYYPDDVDITVSYVAPCNFAIEDGRHEPYIAKKAGDKKSRKKVLNFQKETLKRRNKLMPMFENLTKSNNYTFNADLDEIYDFCVLEYSFAFWQWGTNPDNIPSLDSSDEEIFNHFMKIASPDYFSLQSLESIGSFFVQAAHELGYYGYDTRPFGKMLTIANADNYLARLFLPKNFSADFDDASAIKTTAFLELSDANVIFIYGANDPWTASGFNPPPRDNYLKIVQSGAGHGIRIGGLSEGNKKLVYDKLSQWLGMDVPTK